MMKSKPRNLSADDRHAVYAAIKARLSSPVRRRFLPVRRPFARVSHQPTLAVAGLEYERLADRAAALEAAEVRLNLRLPAAVRDWYETAGTEFFAGLDDGGAWSEIPPEAWELEPGWQAMVAIAREWERETVIAIWLNGLPDPPIRIKLAPDEPWGPCAERFSDFVFARVWDECGAQWPATMAVRDIHFSPADLADFETRFPYTAHTRFGRTAARTYRFIGDDHAIEIRIGDHGATWLLFAADNDELRDVSQWVFPDEKRPFLRDAATYATHMADEYATDDDEYGYDYGDDDDGAG